jgi:tetratricopeptide (TPR) repeat protein
VRAQAAPGRPIAPLALALAAALVLLSAFALSFGAGAARGQAADGYRSERAAELTGLGARFLEAGDRVSAAGYFREAIGIDPAFAPAYVALGELQLARGSTRDAEETFRVGATRAGRDVRLWIGLVRALEASGSTGEAESVLVQAEGTFRRDRTLLAFRADRAEDQGRWSLALSLTRRLASIAEEERDAEALARLRARERALAVLVGGLDPVRAPPAHDDSVRSALAGR